MALPPARDNMGAGAWPAEQCTICAKHGPNPRFSPGGNAQIGLPGPSLAMNLLLLALVPACFALNPVTGRALVEDFGPATLSLVRWSLSGLP